MRRAGLALLTVSLVVCGALQSLRVLAATHKLETRRGVIYASQPDEALKFLHEQVSPKEAVFVYPYYPMYYFLADVKNPTRHSILMYHINTPQQFQEVIRNLERQKVKYVLWDTLVAGDHLKLFFPNYQPVPEKEQVLEKYLQDHYRFVGLKDGFRLLVRREPGEASVPGVGGGPGERGSPGLP